MVSNLNSIISSGLILVLVNCRHHVIWLKVLRLSLGLALQAMAMVSYSNSIVFFSLILVLLIPYDELKEPIIVSEIGFAGNNNSEQLPFDCIF